MTVVMLCWDQVHVEITEPAGTNLGEGDSDGGDLGAIGASLSLGVSSRELDAALLAGLPWIVC